ncbi:hypothetical protein DFS34DRAFT_569811, partial [Phlyctochytrium arcticum]
LGELVWPDEPDKQSILKIQQHTTMHMTSTGYTFEQHYRKNDRLYQGSFVCIFRQESQDIPAPCRPWEAMVDYTTWRDQVHGANVVPLFVFRDGTVPTRKWFVRRLKLLAGDSFSGHSLRAGGATWLASIG